MAIIEAPVEVRKILAHVRDKTTLAGLGGEVYAARVVKYISVVTALTMTALFAACTGPSVHESRWNEPLPALVSIIFGERPLFLKAAIKWP